MQQPFPELHDLCISKLTEKLKFRTICNGKLINDFTECKTYQTQSEVSMF